MEPVDLLVDCCFSIVDATLQLAELVRIISANGEVARAIRLLVPEKKEEKLPLLEFITLARNMSKL